MYESTIFLLAYIGSYVNRSLHSSDLNYSRIRSCCFSGKASKGALLSLSRQILFLLPLLVIMADVTGVEGIMYAGPIADLQISEEEWKRVLTMDHPNPPYVWMVRDYLEDQLKERGIEMYPYSKRIQEYFSKIYI